MQVTPQAVANYGALTVFFAVGISLMVYYIFRLYPEDRKYQRESNKMLFEQVALSRQALETSNMVIAQNSDEMREARASHQRIGERLGCVEDVLSRHDGRSEDIARNVAVIKAVCEESHKKAS